MRRTKVSRFIYVNFPSLITALRNIFDWVLAFSADRLNPGEIMAQIRAALTDIFVKGEDPWVAIVNNSTASKTVLSHTPIVYIDKDSEQQARCLQLVLSAIPGHPWGFIPLCGVPLCPARRGDVHGSASKHLLAPGDFHGRLRLKCRVCNFGIWITRPDWIIATRLHSYFFSMPWPLTEEQLDEAMGRNCTWKLIAQEVNSTSSKGKKRELEY